MGRKESQLSRCIRAMKKVKMQGQMELWEFMGIGHEKGEKEPVKKACVETDSRKNARLIKKTDSIPCDYKSIPCVMDIYEAIKQASLTPGCKYRIEAHINSGRSKGSILSQIAGELNGTEIRTGIARIMFTRKCIDYFGDGKTLTHVMWHPFCCAIEDAVQNGVWLTEAERKQEERANEKARTNRRRWKL